ncbi:MAG: threonylcarbamoyl-AMP synthase [Candidatus Lloydbacteria bacterium RIFCSPLOWO2_01_FULL_50_20]|uniref:L-threonylcarbamoyladenylate synthase n=1 Tax=Candidatus Lloydbacteria bacterium RIFCSPLOWO2_01_FULL_50_20 TaxID=1798665 RepID=A0A1G2DES9_9BACT|nr:MAG: threonylcarbamoyl-AMP synthase [Candidatus Lloydbacteria bacterium RIFCSPHIGHO2_02_FULL_50_11]OGZ11380.1 MAG: threonylcarbamoyl-AMP synthase [Candidatus Lloydbacteria bacterium RIFCSPLOWO2_01_FULL_50_20]
MEQWEQIVRALGEGCVGILPTDTLYGIVGSALLPETVERIYTLKERDPQKPLIVLVADIDDLERFGVVLSDRLSAHLNTYWPGPYSIILPTADDDFDYLHRGLGTIAFRLPDKEELRKLLREAGPIVAPSANIEGQPPAQTIEQAQKYFGTAVDFYIDGGEIDGKPSTILDLCGEETRKIR